MVSTVLDSGVFEYFGTDVKFIETLSFFKVSVQNIKGDYKLGVMKRAV